MSLEAWGDTDEDGLIDAMAYPVAAALAEVRDEIEEMLVDLRGKLTHVGIGNTCRREKIEFAALELETVQKSVEEKIEADMEPRQ